MSTREQLRHLLLDCSFPGKDKTAQLEEDYGAIGCWYFVCLLCGMSEATDGKISRARALQIARSHNIDREDAIKILGFLLAKKMIEESGENYTNCRVKEDQERVAAKRKEWREKRQRQRERQKGDVPEDKDETKGATPQSAQKIEDRRSEQVNNKNGAPPEHWNFSGPLDNPEIREWAPKVREKLHRAGRTFGQFELEAAASTHGVDRVIAAMKHTCELTAPKNLCYPAEEVSEQKKKAGKHEKYELVLSAIRKFGRDWGAASVVLPAELHPAIRSVGWGKLCEAKSGDDSLKYRFFEALG